MGLWHCTNLATTAALGRGSSQGWNHALLLLFWQMRRVCSSAWWVHCHDRGTRPSCQLCTPCHHRWAHTSSFCRVGAGKSTLANRSHSLRRRGSCARRFCLAPLPAEKRTRASTPSSSARALALHGGLQPSRSKDSLRLAHAFAVFRSPPYPGCADVQTTTRFSRNP